MDKLTINPPEMSVLENYGEWIVSQVQSMFCRRVPSLRRGVLFDLEEGVILCWGRGATDLKEGVILLLGEWCNWSRGGGRSYFCWGRGAIDLKEGVILSLDKGTCWSGGGAYLKQWNSLVYVAQTARTKIKLMDLCMRKMCHTHITPWVARLKRTPPPWPRDDPYSGWARPPPRDLNVFLPQRSMTPTTDELDPLLEIKMH